MTRLRIASCQINTTVGALDRNVERIVEALREAEAAGCDLAVFPELSVTGYPPEDLLLRSGFIDDNLEALAEVARHTGDCVAVIGFVDVGRDLWNAAAVCAHGEVRGRYHKRQLPNYGVFDEARYFAPGDQPNQLWSVGGVAVGVSICEDAWDPAGSLLAQSDGGAELMANLNASPFSQGKQARRERLMSTRAADSSAGLIYVNQVGGQDELVFDGGSMIFDADGELVARSPQFDEEVLVVDLDVQPVYRKRLLDPRGRSVQRPLPVTATRPIDGEPSAASSAGAPPSARRDRRGTPTPAPLLDGDEELYRAIVLGTRDYLHKNGFTDAVIGLSGGIDSTLVAALAVDALGADHVHGVLMPSRYSSDHSRSDAEELAENLGIAHQTIPIEAAHLAFLGMLAGPFEGREPDLTEENLQSRVRGMVLMALSNKFGWAVLSTGNKSEAAVGYTTLYGDTVGAYALIKDLYKLKVYDLCRWRNAAGDSVPIPPQVITKPPSAELRPDQRDDQSLPSYEILDPILHGYIDQDLTVDELADRGFDRQTVQRIAGLVDRAEFKRRQTPVGPRLSTKAFGRDRRSPITNGYR